MLDTRRLLFFALIAIRCLTASSLRAEILTKPDASNLVVISDVDDTIRISQILSRNGRRINTARNYMTPNTALMGMPDLYQALAASGAQFAYVSSIPKKLQGLTTRFLRNAGFPQGALYSRQVKDRVANKVKAIKSIMYQHPDATFLCFGDNGEHVDQEAYYRVSQDQNLGPRIKGIFIHNLYDRPEDPLPEGQAAFLTAGDAAVRVSQLNLVSKKTATDILNRVADSLFTPQSPWRDLEITARSHQAYPLFAEISPEQIHQILGELRQAQGNSSAEVSEALSRLEKGLVERARSAGFLGCILNWFLVRQLKKTSGQIYHLDGR